MKNASISIRKGKGNLRHNVDVKYRMKLSHTDDSLVDKNLVLINEDIKNVYHKLFDEALLKYNAKYINDLKHQNRIISNYYQHIKTGKQEKTHFELIIEVGNKNDGINDLDKIKMLQEILKRIKEENPNIYVFQATIHTDEPDSGPHLHLDYVPFVTNQNRGLSTRVSHDKALAEMGYKKEKCISSTKDKAPNIYNGFRNRIETELEEIMSNYNYNHVIVKNDNEHEDHRQWREKVEYNKQLAAKIEQKKKTLNSIEAKVSTISTINEIKARDSLVSKNDVVLNRDDYHILKKTALASANVHTESKKVKEISDKVQQKSQMLKEENAKLKDKVSSLTEDNNDLKEKNANLNTFLNSLKHILINQFGINIYEKRKQIIEVGKWLANFASKSVNGLLSTTSTMYDKTARIFAEIGFKEPLNIPNTAHIDSNRQKIELTDALHDHN